MYIRDKRRRIRPILDFKTANLSNFISLNLEFTQIKRLQTTKIYSPELL